VLPLRKQISQEVLLRYNGMLASVFELLSDSRDQINSVNAAITAQRDFWIADTELQAALSGKGHANGSANGHAKGPANANANANAAPATATATTPALTH
jgi:outer membrane protein TolC